MRNGRLLLGLALALASAVCQADAPAPRMTGERLLQRLEPVNPANVSVGPSSKLNREEFASVRSMNNVEFVQGYLDALYDATEGTSWCYDAKSKTPKPDTFWDESRWGLHRLSADQLKRNAASLLVEIWSAKWPCSPDRRSRK